MRPVATQRNFLQYPLDSILGSEAQVRLLRAMLLDINRRLSVSSAGALAGLSHRGTQMALNRLVDTGIVIQNGQGRSIQYSLHEDHSLIRSLHDLFCREHERFEGIVSEIKKALTGLNEIRSAWIDSMPVGSRGAVELSVVVNVKAIDWISTELRTRIAKVESSHDLVIEFTVFTRADEKQPDMDSVVLIQPPDSVSQNQGGQMKSHREADERSLLYARGVVELMKDDPSLIVRAKRHLSMLLRDDQGTASHDLLEWKQLLETYSTTRLADLLVSESSRAIRLRQSSPFYAVLTSDERDKVFGYAEEHR